MASELEVHKITTGAGSGGNDPTLIVGGTGNAQLKVRHIDGKASASADMEGLYLNQYSTGNVVMCAGGGAVSIPSAAGTQVALTVKGGNNLVDNIALNITNQAGDSGTNIRNNGQLFASTLATFSGGIKAEKGILSGTVLIDDEGVTTITPPRKGGFMKLIVDSATAEAGQYPQNIHSGEIFFDCGSSLGIVKCDLSSSLATQLDVSVSNLTGTTGTNGNVTIGVQSDVIKIENQSGYQYRFNYFLYC